MKKWISDASYEELLMKWRFSPIGDPFFRGDVGTYYREQIKKKRAELPIGELQAISKRVESDPAGG